ncbi:hypothetical protein [Paraglaciecola sp. 25GB23A]|uniref:hypothetical protein n=1 Tax=Paraglaciecola sp. 25GB23A TaxID=3156068 RepID=UPI0032AFBA4F
MEYAIKNLKATKVDVNEQNPNAIRFYNRLGFVQTGRSMIPKPTFSATSKVNLAIPVSTMPPPSAGEQSRESVVAESTTAKSAATPYLV